MAENARRRDVVRIFQRYHGRPPRPGELDRFVGRPIGQVRRQVRSAAQRRDQRNDEDFTRAGEARAIARDILGVDKLTAKQRRIAQRFVGESEETARLRLAQRFKPDDQFTTMREARRMLRNILDVDQLSFEQRQLAEGFLGQSEAATRRGLQNYSRGLHDAERALQSTLRRYGLEELSSWAWDQVVQGRSDAEIKESLYAQRPFQERFKAIFVASKKGLPALSPEEVISAERTIRGLMRGAGLPKGFYDQPDDFVQFIGNGLSAVEIQERIDGARVALYERPPEWREELNRLFGVAEGEMLAMFLDVKRALPLIQKRVAATGLATAARMTGFGDLTTDEALRLTDLGVSEDLGGQGFAELARSSELFTGLPGAGEDDISRQVQLGAVFEGDAAAQRLLQERARSRVARFEGGGGAASDRSGLAGLGVASR